ncbi:MAG TPA: DUF1570 domain-containing protein [Pyrinomonadaceae bacterium]
MKILITALLVLVVVSPHHSTLARSPLTPSVVQTRDSWRSIQTNNLFVIGNTDPENLRQVAAWLEFFHTAFGRLVSRSVVNNSIPTTVVVFRDEASFLPFKPLYQGKPINLAGYFQPGNDMNYIAILLDRDQSRRDPFSTAFHEYVHLHLRQNVAGVPLWLNEGLAEFYSSLQFSGGEALIGVPLGGYVRLLRAQQMLPLDTLFSIDTDSPHYNEQDKTGMFYGQSWALVHYLMMGDGARSQEQFRQFLQLVSRGEGAGRALEIAFGTNVAAVEKGLQDYVRRGNFSGQRIALGEGSQNYASYTAMQRSQLTEAEANYYLGDLLLHTNRQNDAERYFIQAIAQEPNLPLANASMGLLRVEQRRYAEAKKYFQKATATQQNYLVHYLYAYTLSREGVEANAEHPGYSDANVAIMREQLLRAIKLAPNFAPAYYLLAMVDVVADQQLDEAEAMALKAHQLSPSKRANSLLLAHIYARRSNRDAARTILEPLTRDSDASVREEAQELLDSLNGSSGRTSSSSRQKVKLNEAVMAEPESPGGSAGIGGSSSGGSIRDGRTIVTSGSMPTVDDVLARYVQAMGGAAAINAVNSRVAKGTLDIVGVSRNGSFEIYAQAPNKTLSVIQAHTVGTVRLGFNGKTGWAQNMNGLRPLKGLELGAVQRDSDFYGTVRLKSVFAKVSLLGKSKIGYREVYVLDLQPPAGPSERLFLDVETCLPVRLNAARMNGGQLASVEIYFDDWRDVDGIKVPFRISQNFSGRALAFTVKEIRHNVAIDDRLLDLPMK